MMSNSQRRECMENEQVVDVIIDRMLSETRKLPRPSPEDSGEVFGGNSGLGTTGVAIANMIKALGCIGGPKAVDPIISVLNAVLDNRSDYADRIRDEGLDALGKIGDKESIIALISYFEFREQDRNVQDRALAAIRRIGSPAIDALTAALESNNSAMKENALHALGEIGDKKAIPHIIPLLKADDVEVAGFAALAIAMCAK
jgi:HEAT repeat protein